MIPRARGIQGTHYLEAAGSEAPRLMEKVCLELQASKLQWEFWLIWYYFPLKLCCAVYSEVIARVGLRCGVSWSNRLIGGYIYSGVSIKMASAALHYIGRICDIETAVSLYKAWLRFPPGGFVQCLLRGRGLRWKWEQKRVTRVVRGTKGLFEEGCANSNQSSV